jgi:hypothetical protein
MTRREGRGAGGDHEEKEESICEKQQLHTELYDDGMHDKS